MLLPNIFIVCLLVLIGMSSCSETTTQYDYWKFENGDSTIRLSAQISNDAVNGIVKKYYRNGQLLSKVRYEDDKPMEIFGVYDSLGNPLKYGSLKNGNGCVISYSDKYGTPEYSGCYVDGEREGWWKYYTFRGEPNGSFFCKKGISDFAGPTFRYVLY